MDRIKKIPQPQFKSAKKLTPLQLNSFRCRKQHTLLTPEQLERIAAANSTESCSGNINDSKGDTYEDSKAVQ